MQDNISELLLRVKDNISYVETHESEKAVLDEIQTDYLNLVELLKLFLISERDIYYGYFLMNMRFQVNFGSKSIAGIKLNEFPPVFEANPLLLCRFTLKEIIYIVCHEIDHVVFNHPAEMLKANPQQDPEIFKRFNLAADAAVNDRLNHEITAENHSFMSMPEGAVTSQVLAKMFRLSNVRPMENYAYYFSLVESRKSNEKSDAFRNGQDSILRENLQGEDSSGQQSESSADNVFSAQNICGKTEDHNWESGEEAEDISAAVRELVNSAVGMMSQESRGMMPGEFMSQVKLINTPPAIPWEKVLKKYVGTVVAGKRKTRMRLNRRQPDRFDLSGSVDDKILKIAVAIDTSASVDNDMLSEIFNEIFEILAKRKHEITVIECDSQVQRTYQARTRADIKPKVKGRGGTYFAPVIDYINEHKYFRDALLIYFTDGFGEQQIPKPRTYRNMWVVFENEKNLSLEEPYGVVLPLKQV